MIIREALATEWETIRELRVQAYEEHAKNIPEAHWLALKKAILSDADVYPGADQMVAIVDGEMVGSVVLFPAKTDAYEGFVEEMDYPEIRMLAVSPHARGKGVASALITECIRRSKEKGYQAIGLHTGEFMHSAMRLYERFGFERLPQYDFEPANDGIIVKAYQLTIG